MAYGTPGSDRRERISQMRSEAAEQQKEEDKTTILAGIGALALAALWYAALFGFTWVLAWGVQQALLSYGVHRGGLMAPFILVCAMLSTVIVGSYLGTRRLMRYLPRRVIKELQQHFSDR